MCGATLEAETIDTFGDVFVAHVADAHADLPYPQAAIRNYGEGLARMTGSTERLPAIGEVEIHPVTEDRVDDWLQLFDHDVFAGFPQWSACYCTEPHFLEPGDEVGVSNPGTWREKRDRMIERFRAGEVFGYLAYVDGRPAGWLNASKRCDYALFERGDDEDATTVGLSCFAIAPPYRGHGIAPKLLDRAVADAGARGAAWVEAYPFHERSDNPNFRGDRRMYDDRGFTEVAVRARDTVVRRPV
jgi:GNAT superfamily N-acetyltransferase